MERLTIDEVIAHCRRHTKDMEEHATPFFFNEADLSSAMVKRYWEHKQVADWLEELKVHRAASKAPKGDEHHMPETMSDFVGNATVASSVFLSCGSTAEAVLKAATAANEKIKEMIRKNSPRQVKYMAGLLGEKYECPECGSALTDEDLLAGHCKWCGQAIKDE